MTNKRMMEIWNEILEKECGCYADELGNRPCEYDETICQKCLHPTISALFEQKWKREVEKSTNTFEVTISDSVTYEFDADNEDEAIFLALEWYSERNPKIELTKKA